MYFLNVFKETNICIKRYEIFDEKNLTNRFYLPLWKFRDCFNRLKVHFSGIHLESNVLTNDMVLDVLELSTNQPFLQQIVANMPHNVLK